jgi:UDP-glucose 4-epimerase
LITIRFTETSVLELANLIISLSNSKSNIIHLPALVEGDMTRRLPDNSIMLSILNRELLPLNDGILKIIKN